MGGLPNAPAAAGAGSGGGRRGDLDRLRLALAVAAYLAVVGLAGAGRWPEEADRWLAPAFFAVAGAAAMLSFRGRRVAEWAVAKVLRLFIPAVAAALLAAVPLLYLKRPGEVDEWAGHLWFLPALLGVSLVGIPLLARLARRPAGPSAARLLAAATVLLPATTSMLPGVGDPVGGAVACFAAWVFGAAATSSPRAEAGLRRLRWPAVAVGAVLAAAALGLRAPGAAGGGLLPAVARAAAPGALAVGVLALGLRPSAAARQVSRRLDEWVLPFFVLSRPAFLAFGRALVDLPLGPVPQACLAAIAAAALSIAACEVARRVTLFRFLAGLPVRNDRP